MNIIKFKHITKKNQDFSFFNSYYGIMNKLQKLRSELEFEKSRTSYLSDEVKFLRKNRHEFMTHLIMIKNMSDNIEIANYISGVYNLQFEASQKKFVRNEYINVIFCENERIAVTKNINFVIEISDYDIHFSINPIELVSVISNLINNAFDACENSYLEGEKIVTLRMLTEKHKSVISISNSGEKIPFEVMDKIFTAGFSTKNKTPLERGFGLYIVKEILDRNNGEIYVKSDNLITEFIVKLPLI